MPTVKELVIVAEINGIRDQNKSPRGLFDALNEAMLKQTGNDVAFKLYFEAVQEAYNQLPPQDKDELQEKNQQYSKIPSINLTTPEDVTAAKELVQALQEVKSEKDLSSEKIPQIKPEAEKSITAAKELVQALQEVKSEKDSLSKNIMVSLPRYESFDDILMENNTINPIIKAQIAYASEDVLEQYERKNIEEMLKDPKIQVTELPVQSITPRKVELLSAATALAAPTAHKINIVENVKPTIDRSSMPLEIQSLESKTPNSSMAEQNAGSQNLNNNAASSPAGGSTPINMLSGDSSNNNPSTINNNQATASSGSSSSSYKGIDLVIYNLLKAAGLSEAKITETISNKTSNAYKGAVNYANLVLKECQIEAGLKKTWWKFLQNQMTSDEVQQKLKEVPQEKLDKALQHMARQLIGQAAVNHGKLLRSVVDGEFNKLSKNDQEKAIYKWTNDELRDSDILAALEAKKKRSWLAELIDDVFSYQNLMVGLFLAAIFMPALLPVIYFALAVRVVRDVVVGVIEGMEKGLSFLAASWQGIVKAIDGLCKGIAMAVKLSLSFAVDGIILGVPNLVIGVEKSLGKDWNYLTPAWDMTTKVGEAIAPTYKNGIDFLSGEKAVQDRLAANTTELESIKFEGLPAKTTEAAKLVSKANELEKGVQNNFTALSPEQDQIKSTSTPPKVPTSVPVSRGAPTEPTVASKKLLQEIKEVTSKVNRNDNLGDIDDAGKPVAPEQSPNNHKGGGRSL